MMEHVRKALVAFSEIVETVLAIVVAVLLIMDIIGLLPRIGEFWTMRGDAEEFSNLLSSILSIVVGTEFIKMLIKPTFSNVTEVLVFLIARHVILADATPIDNLISVISIAILFAMEYFLSRMSDGGAGNSLMSDVSRRFRSRRHKEDHGNGQDSDTSSED